MARSQSQLQILLEQLISEDPADKLNVYFQPPSQLQMEYPAIVYNREREVRRFAGNKPYSRVWGYSLTVIAPDPESELLDKVAALPYCSFDRHYVADNLNHDVFTIFF